MRDLQNKRSAFLTNADAVRYAYRLLSYRGRSEKELKERLARKGFSEDTVRHAISHLVEKGFIDDAALAVSLKRTAEETKLLGAQGIRQFLQHKGISREIIGNVFAENDSDEIIRAKKLVDKKLKIMGNYSDEEKRSKIWRFLSRKGYASETIRQTLRHLKIKEEK